MAQAADLASFDCDDLISQVRIVLSIADRNGFIPDYLEKWRLFDDPPQGINSSVILEKLLAIRILHDARSGMELLSQHPSWIKAGINAG
jgi:hypothetical protein